jgi:hypothetical protein
VPVKEQIPVTLPPGVNTTEDAQVTVNFPGPLTALEIATGPANPLLAGGLPKLVAKTETPRDFPAAKSRVVEFVERP